jgi:hypothetical protein
LPMTESASAQDSSASSELSLVAPVDSSLSNASAVCDSKPHPPPPGTHFPAPFIMRLLKFIIFVFRATL